MEEEKRVWQKKTSACVPVAPPLVRTMTHGWEVTRW